MPGDPKEPEITVQDIDSAPDTSTATAGDKHVSTDDLRDALVRLGEENSLLLEELQQTKKRVRTIEILDELIEPMAKRAFWFMSAYCGVVGAMLMLHDFHVWGFKLPNNVLQFLVGSTATTVIGLVGMVLTGVFVGARKGGRD